MSTGEWLKKLLRLEGFRLGELVLDKLVEAILSILFVFSMEIVELGKFTQISEIARECDTGFDHLSSSCSPDSPGNTLFTALYCGCR